MPPVLRIGEGRACYATRDDQEVSAAAGKNLVRLRLAVGRRRFNADGNCKLFLR